MKERVMKKYETREYKGRMSEGMNGGREREGGRESNTFSYKQRRKKKGRKLIEEKK